MSTTTEVIDSYLALNETQHAEAAIGATRLATKGDGVALYGTIPTWSATNWEIEFDVVFPTTPQTTGAIIIDSETATNRFFFNISAVSFLQWATSGVTSATMDGNPIVSTGTAQPVDGAVHHIKFTGAATFIQIANLLRRYSGTNFSNCTIFNLRLTDLDTSANSSFYAMDETIAGSTFVDTGARAQNGTWVNRLAGDVVTVYPEAIRPEDECWVVVKVEATGAAASTGFAAASSLGVSTENNIIITLPRSGTPEVQGRLSATSSNFSNSAENWGTDCIDGNTHIVMFHKTASGYTGYFDGVAGQTRALAWDAAIQTLRLNGKSDGTAKGFFNIHYAYVYSALSASDRTALLAGENPMYVGTIRQGYNLAGNGDEINGGPDLALYGSPTFEWSPIDTAGLTGTTSDILYTALYNMGYRGSLSDMKAAYYAFYGYGSVTDNMYESLKAAGWKGSVSDMKYEYLRSIS